MKSTTTIRQRGQVTIPSEIRQRADWLTKGSVLAIIASASKEIKIMPYEQTLDSKIDWKKIWERINLARSFKGKRGNLSKFIIEDRHRH